MNIKHILRKDGENDIKLRSRIKKENQLADLSKKVERLQEQLESDEMALTESQEIIAELKAQLNEANELISVLFPLSMNKERALERTTEYMGKWGVK